jgi:hypothetical protein
MLNSKSFRHFLLSKCHFIFLTLRAKLYIVIPYDNTKIRTIEKRNQYDFFITHQSKQPISQISPASYTLRMRVRCAYGAHHLRTKCSKLLIITVR